MRRTSTTQALAALSLLASAMVGFVACGSEGPTHQPRGGDSLGKHGDPLSIAPSIAFLDFDQNADDPSAIALTFDDGPDETNTAKVLDSLKAAGVKATFFINTSNYLDVNSSSLARSLIERMYAEGHHIGNHTVHHYDLASADVRSELDGVYQIMRSIVPGALSQRLVRAPYGDPYFGPQETLDVVAPVVGEYGVHVGWNIDPVEDDCPDSDCVVGGVLASVDAGRNGVVLLHATKANTADALPRLIAELQNRGKRFVLVEDLVVDKYGKHSRDLVLSPSGGTGDTGPVDSGATDSGAPPPPDPSPPGSRTDVYCASLTVTAGTVGNSANACGASGALAAEDGNDAAWADSSSSTKTTAYAQFNLTGVPTSMELDVSYFGDDGTEPLWYWSILNPSTGAWVQIGDNSWAGNWVTTAHAFTIANPARYTDASGHVKIRFKTTSSTNEADLDRMVLEVGY